jgi:hypothetical protein
LQSWRWFLRRTEFILTDHTTWLWLSFFFM